MKTYLCFVIISFISFFFQSLHVISYDIYVQNRNRLTDIENKLMVTKGKQWIN